MKSAIKLFVIAAVFLLCASIYGSGQTAGGADEQQVRAAVEKFTKSFVEADATTKEREMATRSLGDGGLHIYG